MSEAPYKIKQKETEAPTLQSVVAGRQQLHYAVQSRSPIVKRRPKKSSLQLATERYRVMGYS